MMFVRLVGVAAVVSLGWLLVGCGDGGGNGGLSLTERYEAAMAVPNPDSRVLRLLDVAKAQDAAGDASGAEQSLKDAVDAAGEMTGDPYGQASAFGDIAAVPAPWLRHPRGIRDVAEWYVSTVTRRDYVYEVFERQCDVALANLERVYAAVGDRVTVAYLTGTDFGMQTGPFLSPQTYRELYQPFHRRINDWIHKHTAWKTFIHSCGSVVSLIEDFVEAGFDVLNPVQCSAAGMDPVALKRRFGERIVFWGGGVDTQHVLPHGSTEDVKTEVRRRIDDFAPGGGFVFNPVHNIQFDVPPQNIVALWEAWLEYGTY